MGLNYPVDLEAWHAWQQRQNTLRWVKGRAQNMVRARRGVQQDMVSGMLSPCSHRPFAYSPPPSLFFSHWVWPPVRIRSPSPRPRRAVEAPRPFPAPPRVRAQRRRRQQPRPRAGGSRPTISRWATASTTPTRGTPTPSTTSPSPIARPPIPTRSTTSPRSAAAPTPPIWIWKSARPATTHSRTTSASALTGPWPTPPTPSAPLRARGPTAIASSPARWARSTEECSPAPLRARPGESAPRD